MSNFSISRDSILKFPRERYSLSLFLVDRHVLDADADPDPAKWCRFDRIQTTVPDSIINLTFNMLIFSENPVRSTVMVLIYFDVQVFEANIRLLGGLLSAHLLMEDSNFPGLSPDWYLGMDDILSVLHFKLIFIIKTPLLIRIRT